MKRKEFIKIMHRAMDRIESESAIFCCIAISPNETKGSLNDIADDFWENVFRRKNSNSLCFEMESREFLSSRLVKQMRLNALAMYLAQSLAFKTYKKF